MSMTSMKPSSSLTNTKYMSAFLHDNNDNNNNEDIEDFNL